MSKVMALVTIAVAFGATACGATRTTTTIQNPVYPALTSATVSFVSRDHGKDRDSALTVQVMRNTAELVGEVRATGIKFDDDSASGPFVVSLVGPFTTRDIDDGQVRIRLTPDGRDDWTFDMHMTMRFSDGTARDFVWRGLRLDNTTVERVLALGPARI